MSLEDITLTTNKTITRVSNNRRTIRQGEAGLVLPVELVGADDKAVDLSDIVLEFNERKDGGKVVYDSDQSRFNKVDASDGKFVYTLQDDVYSASGTCWFILKKDNTIIDTTKDFYFDVLPDSSIHLSNDNYVTDLSTQIDAFTAQVQKTKEDTTNLIAELKQDNENQVNDANTKINNLVKDSNDKVTAAVKQCNDALTNATNQLNSYDKKYQALESSLNTKLTSIASDWTNQTKAINDAWTQQTQQINSNWSTQSANIDSDYKKQLKDAIDDVNSQKAAAINALNSARDAAIKQATTDFSNKLSSIQSDYDSWKTKTLSDWSSQVKNLQDTLATTKTNIDSANTRMNNILKAVDQAHADFAKIDFSSYRLISDSYSKKEVNDLIAQAGKVKSVNGQTGDIKGLATETELTNGLNDKANASDVYNKAQVNSEFSARDQNITNAQNTANNALPKSGGAMSLTSSITWQGDITNGNTLQGNIGGLSWFGKTDWAKIYGDSDGTDNLDLAFDLGDDGSNHFSFRKLGAEIATIESNGHFTGTVDWDKVWGRNVVTDAIKSKADALQVSNLANQVSATQQTAASANTTAQQALTKVKNLTPFTIITQAQYDKLTDAQKQSGTYGISG